MISEGRRTVPLPDSFRLPEPQDINNVIEGIDGTIVELGGPSAFLGKIRYERRTWASMEYNVLRPLAMQAFRYEDARLYGVPPKTDLSISKAALSGMLFGHMANEEMYPEILSTRNYATDTPINSHLIKDFEAFEKQWGEAPDVSYRLGIQAMSALFVESLSDSTLQRVVRWGDEMVGTDRIQHFNFGFGLALYLAWDAYSDMLVERGDVEAVQQYIKTNMHTN